MRQLSMRLAGKYGPDEARAMARVIMEDVALLKPVDILVAPERTLPDFVQSKVRDIADRVMAGEPMQYVLGHARFCGMDLIVTPATLIPRPETEQLVDMIADRSGSRSDLRVLDCGTGSGCIAVALARALRFPLITAIDISEAALEVARANARKYKVKIDFSQADMLTYDNPAKWDIIVSNPPYVMERERAGMEPHVTEYEPAAALFVPDDDPMLFYRPLIRYAKTHLNDGGALYMEINPLCESRFEGARLVRDMYGRIRFAIYDKKGEES